MKHRILKIICHFLAICTRFYLWRTKPFVIGVTGSVGKTSCRTIIAQVLSQIGQEKVVYSSPKNFNSELWLIFSIFKIESYTPSIKNLILLSLKILKDSLFWKKKYDILVAEYGIDSPGDMDFLISVMKPDIGIITKLDSVHSDNFPWGTDELWRDKFKLLLSTKWKTYSNAGDVYLQEHASFLSQNSYIFTWEEKTILLSHENSALKQSFLWNKKDISINLIGEESVEYTCLALDIATDIGFDFSERSYSFEFFQQEWRFSIFERNKNVFIDSSYNAGPNSMKQVIENTKKFQQGVYPDASIIYVLWDMREIGDIRIRAHEEIASHILAAACVFTVGPEMYNYMIPKLKELWYTGEIHSSLSSRDIWKKLKSYLKNHDQTEHVVLFKGSQNTIFVEEALSAQLTVVQRKKLPRQSQDWLEKKEGFFKNL